MKNYFEEQVSAIRPLDGRRVHVVFYDGFEGEVDLAPLIDKGPLYESLRTDESFKAVTVHHGVPHVARRFRPFSRNLASLV